MGKTISSLVLLLVSGYGCTITPLSKVDQSEVYQSYAVNYTANSNSEEATAEFHLSGSAGNYLELDVGSISNSIFGTLSKCGFCLFGVNYEKSGTGFNATHTFTFTDGDGTVFNNSVTGVAVSLSSPPGTISKAGGTTIDFTGAVVSNQTVEVSISVLSDGNTTSTYNSVTSGTSVIFDATKLDPLATGTGTITVTRTVSPGIQNSHKGGSIRYRYTGATASVTVNP